MPHVVRSWGSNFALEKKIFKIHVAEKWMESFADAAYETKWPLQSIMVKATKQPCKGTEFSVMHFSQLVTARRSESCVFLTA